MSNPNAITSAVIAQTLGPNPPLWPVAYDHLASFNSRDDIVPNRLAGHMGPLLGIPHPDGLLGNMSWLANYATLNLTEISQGFPKGTLDSQGKPLTATDTIAGATLNKYGPSTKDAAALTGINRLFEAQTTSFVEAMGGTAFGQLSEEEKVRSWGGLMLSSLWCQPLLFMAGMKASVFQNAHRPLEMNYPAHLIDQPRARCEVQPHGSYVAGKYTPFDFNLVSDTFLTLSNTLEASATGRPSYPKASFRDTVHRLIAEGLSGSEDLVIDRDKTSRAVLRPAEKLAEARDIFAGRLLREVLL